MHVTKRVRCSHYGPVRLCMACVIPRPSVLRQSLPGCCGLASAAPSSSPRSAMSSVLTCLVPDAMGHARLLLAVLRLIDRPRGRV